MKLSNKQTECFDACMHFFLEEPHSQLFVFSGVAGSGKTVLINELTQLLSKEYYKEVAILTLTGKASQVLRNKGVKDVQTIHSFLYHPIIDDVTGELQGFEPKSASDITSDFIIIDEASMVDEELLDDIASLGRKILMVGDENQLPPISKDNFNPMDVTDIRLEEIHRQAADNPIIQLSQHILSSDTIPLSFKCDKINFIKRHQVEKHLRSNGTDYDVILCGTNKRRVRFNVVMREVLGFSGALPNLGERIICLRNNNKGEGMDVDKIFNGEVFVVDSIREDKRTDHHVHLYDVTREDGEYRTQYEICVHDNIWHNGEEWLYNFKYNSKIIAVDKFDYASAITVHKSQGSEYENVLFVDDDVSFFLDRAKFRYTAVTRSSDRITIAK